MTTGKSTPRVLVTGGSGFIGTHFCRQAQKLGWEISVLDLVEPRDPVGGVTYHRGDILEDTVVGALLEQVDHVVHLAARVSVPLCDLDPVGSYVTNFLGTVKLIEAIARLNRQDSTRAKIALYFASSAAIYGNEGDRGTLDESRPSPMPLSHYAHQKHACEGVLSLFSSEVPSWAFRFFNVYGTGQDPKSPYAGVISTFSERLQNGRPLKLFGDGSQTRDFIAVDDIVAGLIRAVELPSQRKDGSAINLCTGTQISVREIGEILAEILGAELKWEPGPSRPGDVRHSCGNYARAKEILDWSPQIPIATGFREMLKPGQ